MIRYINILVKQNNASRVLISVPGTWLLSYVLLMLLWFWLLSWVYSKDNKNWILMKWSYLFVPVGLLMWITKSLLEILLLMNHSSGRDTCADTKKQPDAVRRKTLMFKVRTVHQTTNLTNLSSIKSIEVSNFFTSLKSCHYYKVFIPLFDFSP